jgi:hypothetical protein
MGDHLVVDPRLPERIGVMALLDIPGRWAVSTPSRAGGLDVSRGRPEGGGLAELRSQ